MLKKYVHKTNSTHKTTMDIGKLYPIQCLDVLPGQVTYLRNSALFRFQPLVAPAFVKMNAYLVSFYVPYRILWSDYNEMISGRKNIQLPETRIKFMPNFGAVIGHYDLPLQDSILDYLGFYVPPRKITQENGQAQGYDINFQFLPILAYHKIWNDHFRVDDDVLQPPLDMDGLFNDFSSGCILDSFDNYDAFKAKLIKLYGLRRVNWGKDRFTSALLEAETDPTINLPISSSGTPMEFTTPRVGDGYGNIFIANQDNWRLRFTNRQDAPWSGDDGSIAADLPLYYKGGLSSVNLADFRLAMELWNFKQNQSIYGDSVEAYFRKYGVRNLDARLQKSEVIGGYAQTMQISDIMATDGANLGQQGGHAIGYAKKRTFKHYAPEPGVIMTMCYLRPQADYNGAIPRLFLKKDMMDFYQMEFNSGYQPIYSCEVGGNPQRMIIPSDENERTIFGYEERYSEYRAETSITSGALRPGRNLSHWANPRVWKNDPVLNSNFLECNPSNQIWSAPNEDKAIVYLTRGITKKCFVPKHSKVKFKF